LAVTRAKGRKDTERLARRIAELCLDNKAQDVVILDLEDVTDMTDFFVIASGTSDTHVRSTAERVVQSLESEGEAPTHLEGVTQGRWALVDYVDVVLHVFHPSMRAFYQLERLWSDARVIRVAAQGVSV
jgi:ribosome-associated protein